ncbi:metallophosphoesterase [Microbacterium hominis]|uniref:Metallophosphoesterase n=2 Tax=Microbacteriaceae TaxID=85023 RepID=A0A2K9D7B0_9MICO|nr:metallophosphoesterase [Microbacterium hominis]
MQIMTQILYTSDPHVQHPMLARLRGFLTADGEADTTAHDAWYAEMWREHVTKRDLVYVAGDLTVGGVARERYALELIRSLPGRKVFVAGNHDRTHPAHRDSVKAGMQAEWLETFDAVLPFAVRRVMIGGVKRQLAVSHFPLFGDHTREDRFDEWRLKDSGRWHLHGHTHNPEQRVHDGHQLHVGIDAWGRPLTESEVIRIIEAAEAGREHDVSFRQLIDAAAAAQAD